MVWLWLVLFGCGGRAAWSDDAQDVPGAENAGERPPDDLAGAGASGEATGAPASPLVPLGLEWQVLFSGEEQPTHLAADERFLYWVSTDVRRRRYFLRAASLGGGDPVTLSTGRPGLRFPVPAGEFVYFEESGTGGRIARLPRTGGSEETIVSSDGAQGFALDGDDLYWTEMGTAIDSGQLYRTSLSERRTETIAEGLLAPQRIALYGDFVYFASERRTCPGEASAPSSELQCIGGGVHRVRREGGPVQVLHSGGATRDLVVNDGGVYWFDSAAELLMFAPFRGDEQALASTALADMGPFAFDSGALYWAGQSRVMRMPFDTSLPDGVGPEVSRALSVAVAGDWLYVAEGGLDRISRTPTVPVERD